MRDALRERLSDDEFDAVEIAIRRGERIRLAQVFQRAKSWRVEAPVRIWYGGCRLIAPRFGRGFKLEFIDKLAGAPAVIYVGKERLEAYRFKSALLDVVDAAGGYSYLNAYVWGTFALNQERGQYEAELKSLKHLAIFTGKPLAGPAD